MRCLAFITFLLLCTALPAAELSRVVKSFDFEERQTGNAEELPRDWVKLEGPGLPHYVNGRLAGGHAAGGRYAFRFDLNGSSLIYRYPHGHIAAVPGATYRVTAAVSTDSVPSARARLTATFADLDGRPIKNATRHSTPFVGAPDAWGALSIECTAPPAARWLVLELGFVQPTIWQDASLGKQSLFDQDIHATAHFDDVVVTQVPVVDVTCDKPTHVYSKSEPTVLHVRVVDRVTEDLAAQLVITDAAGRAVHQQSGRLDLTATDAAASKTATLSLPPLPPGAYRATLGVVAGGMILGQHTLDLIRLADDNPAVRPDARFGFDATDVPVEAWPQLPGLLANLGAARVKLAVWDERSDVESAAGGTFNKLLDDLRRSQITPTALIAALPPRLAAEAGGAGLERLPGLPAAAWQPELSQMIARYAGYLDRWQFGTDAQAAAFAEGPKLRAAYDVALKTFDALLDQPDLAMPWPAYVDLNASLPANLAVTIPPDVLPHQIPLYVRDLSTRPGQQYSLYLRPLQAGAYGRAVRNRDLVLRIAYALASGARRIDLPLPARVLTRDGLPPEFRPDETLLIVRTLLATLGNAVYKGRVPVSDDVEAMLFDRAGEGVLLVWAKDAAAAPFRIVLGNRPQRVDLDGSVSPVLQPKDDSGVIEIIAGPAPFFLTGIDGHLAQLRCSIAFDNPLIESAYKPHLRRLRFTNPYPHPISGRLRLSAPAGWTVTLLQRDFALGAGEAYDGPVTIEFPYNSPAGDKVIVCDVALTAERTQQFKVPVALKLGLADIGVETIAMRSGGEIIVQQVITHYGDKPANYTAFVACPGHPRQERLLTGLKPGTTTIKKYRIPSTDRTPGLRVRSGVKETDGNRILNDEVTVQ